MLRAIAGPGTRSSRSGETGPSRPQDRIAIFLVSARIKTSRRIDPDRHRSSSTLDFPPNAVTRKPSAYRLSQAVQAELARTRTRRPSQGSARRSRPRRPAAAFPPLLRRLLAVVTRDVGLASGHVRRRRACRGPTRTATRRLLICGCRRPRRSSARDPTATETEASRPDMSTGSPPGLACHRDHRHRHRINAAIAALERALVVVGPRTSVATSSRSANSPRGDVHAQGERLGTGRRRHADFAALILTSSIPRTRSAMGPFRLPNSDGSRACRAGRIGDPRRTRDCRRSLHLDQHGKSSRPQRLSQAAGLDPCAERYRRARARARLTDHHDRLQGCLAPSGYRRRSRQSSRRSPRSSRRSCVGHPAVDPMYHDYHYSDGGSVLLLRLAAMGMPVTFLLGLGSVRFCGLDHADRDAPLATSCRRRADRRAEGHRPRVAPTSTAADCRATMVSARSRTSSRWHVPDAAGGGPRRSVSSISGTSKTSNPPSRSLTRKSRSRTRISSRSARSLRIGAISPWNFDSGLRRRSDRPGPARLD